MLENLLGSFVQTTAKLFAFFVFFGIGALIVKSIARAVPDKYKDGKIAPKSEEVTERSGYVIDLEKRLKDAGVETERDLL